MYIFILLAAILCVTQLAAQEYDNPIFRPRPGEVVQVGSSYNIVWTPTKGDIISIEIWNQFSLARYLNGSNCFLDDNNTLCSQIAQNIPNSGSFLWQIPGNTPPSNSYYLDIYVPNPDSNGPYYYMTGNFTIDKVALPSSTSITPSKSTPIGSTNA